MIELDNCPKCNVSLIGSPIPEASRHLFGAATHFRRDIGVEIPGVYDGVAFWQCPDCGYQWHRFGEGDYRRKRLEARGFPATRL